jgi:hypothetical protein
LKRRIFKVAVAAIAAASAVGLTTLSATAAVASPALSAPRLATSAAATSHASASPGAITDTPMLNQDSGLWLRTEGHNNPVQASATKASFISEIDCSSYPFPNTNIHTVCLLENESGLCLDASSVPHVTAESCQPNDLQELWWRKATPFSDTYWFINAYWSTDSGLQYMTEANDNPGSPIGVAGSGHGYLAEWIY